MSWRRPSFQLCLGSQMRYIVSAVTTKGRSMAGANKDSSGEPRPVRPVHPSSSLDGHRVLLGVLLVLIGISAIVGVVVAAVSGQGTVALIIALFAAAFFSRVGC
jgi:hypothetical protein